MQAVDGKQLEEFSASPHEKTIEIRSQIRYIPIPIVTLVSWARGPSLLEISLMVSGNVEIYFRNVEIWK